MTTITISALRRVWNEFWKIEAGATFIDLPKAARPNSWRIEQKAPAEGPGLSIELQAFPIDSRLVVLPPDP